MRPTTSARRQRASASDNPRKGSVGGCSAGVHYLPDPEPAWPTSFMGRVAKLHPWLRDAAFPHRRGV